MNGHRQAVQFAQKVLASRTGFIQRAVLCLAWLVLAALAYGGSVRLITIEAESGKPIACRIHLKDAANKPVQPKHLPFWKDHFVCPGSADLELDPGRYHYEIERGPEYSTASGAFSVTADEPSSVTNSLRRLVHLAREGWWSGEFHVHRPVADAELLMRAEDLHFAQIITWWNARNFWATQPQPTHILVRFDGDRFYHLMAGEDERGGGALLYFNLPRPLDIVSAMREYPSPVTFLRQARMHREVWVDVEKPFWLDAPVWFASGMVDSVGIAHNHMHRSGVLENEAWGKTRDRERFPGPQGNGHWTQQIYYHLLNCGLRLPPSAGSASGVLPNPVGYNRAYVYLEGEPSYDKWFEGLRAGRVFVSNGPLLRCRANSKLPGHVFRAGQGEQIKLDLTMTLDSRDPVLAVELIKDGRVERSVPVAELKGGKGFGQIVFQESGWFLIRAMANAPGTFRFASTGPFYVEVGDKPRRISRGSAQFFLDWVRERMRQIRIEDAEQRAEVLQPHQEAERFWQDKSTQANAD